MNRKFVFTTLVASLLLVGSLSAHASYNFKVFIKGLPPGTSGTGQILEAPATPVSLTLASAILPEATRGASYSYDFAQLLSVTGAALAPSSIAWSTISELPPGLSLGTDGVLSGTPTIATSANAEIVVTHTDKEGRQVYSVVVNGHPMDVAQISAGGSHTCAVTTSGGAKCWGNNGNGQTGDGSTVQRLTPVDVSGLTSGVASISGGHVHTCAVTTSGGAKCWGFNGNGPLGDGTGNQRLMPVDVSGLTSGVASISASGFHTCAVTASGGAKCWGNNGNGQTGDGSTVQRLTPVDVSGLISGVVSISMGSTHTCAVTTSGGAKCWGNNGNGQLGDGTTTQRNTPVDVSGLTSGVASISGGDRHACARTTSGEVKCWGQNTNGQLGDGSTVQRLTPVDVSELTSGVTSIEAGSYHTCSVTASGGAKCWGRNPSGQLGDGSQSQRNTPVDVDFFK